MKKKPYCLLLLLILCFLISSAIMPEPAFAATQANNYKVADSSLIVRKDPNASAESIGTLSSGKHIYVYSVNSDKWCRIKLNGQTGWVPYSSLKKINLTGTQYTVIEDEAKIYSNSDGDGEVLSVAKKNDNLEILEVNDKWGKTIVNGYYGYVKMWRLKKSADVRSDSSASSTGKPASDYQVDNSYLNIRSGPSTKYEKLGILNRDDVITIAEQKGGWGRFTYKDQTAWVLMSYLKPYTAPAADNRNASDGNTDARSQTVKQGKPGWHLSNNIWEFYNDEGSLKFASNGMHKAWSKINGGTSSTSYYIVVDTAACETYIFKKGSSNSWIPYKKFICSPGKPSTPTRKGTFTVKTKGYSFGGSTYTCYYYTQFYGGYLFHSILYNRGTFNVRDGRLGQQLSHGCVRLSLDNAKWIQDNMPTGTKVLVY